MNSKKAVKLLKGKWNYALDRDDRGVSEEWFKTTLSKQLELPGSLNERGIGDEVSADTQWTATLYDPLWYKREGYEKYGVQENVKIPFLLQPDKYYVGVAWYQRKIIIPTNWDHKRIVLSLERTHWQTEVWLDDIYVGANNSLSTAHKYELGILPAGEYTLSIRVDNQVRLGVGWNAHSVTDHTQGNWNGIIGEISLEATSPVWIDTVAVFPDAMSRTARVLINIGNITGVSRSGTLGIGSEHNLEVEWNSQQFTQVETEISLDPNAELWDEFNPVLHDLEVTLTSKDIEHRYLVKFGIREISVDGTDIKINGRKVFFRGTHEGCSFPLTGYPAMDVESWRRIILTCKEYGLNHMRFHSWCPPEAAFVAADELGFYLQPEGPMWARHKGSISPDTPEEKFLYQETDRILNAYGNHPSFVLFAYGNEPGGKWRESLSKWVQHYKNLDDRRLYATESGWPLDDEFADYQATGADYAVFGRIGMNMVRGYRGWQGKDYAHTVRNTNVPIIAHEVGQHCVFPDFNGISKYTGAMQPNNYRIFKETMQEHGLFEQAEDFMMASGKLQVLSYKEDIEASLRTPGLAGFQLLDLHDYPGQGSAIVGVLDVFWDAKPYINATEFRRFCNETVLLARMKQHVFYPGDDFKIPVEIAHFGSQPLNNVTIKWQIIDQQNVSLITDEFIVDEIEFGSGISLGTISAKIDELPTPAQYRLEVGMKGTEFANDWNFWVYPKPQPKTKLDDDIIITETFDSQTQEHLNDGGKVLLVATSGLSWDSPPFGFHPVFWNRLMSPKWERTLGILCDSQHLALQQFPTDYHTDWQWADVLMPACRGINLESLPSELQPIIQGIDDWNRSLKLGLLFECRVGKGKLIMSGIDFAHLNEKRPATKQLLASVIKYMGSNDFNPEVALTKDQISNLLYDPRIMTKLGAKVHVAGAVEGCGAEHLIDGDPNSYWQSGNFRDLGPGLPLDIVIEFPDSIPISGLICVNRQNSVTHEGAIKDYLISVGDAQGEWEVVKRGVLPSSYSPQKVEFTQIVNAEYVRLEVLSSWDNRPIAALAELAVVYEGKNLKDIGESKLKDFYSTSGTAEVDEPV